MPITIPTLSRSVKIEILSMPGVKGYVGAETAGGGDDEATQNRMTRLECERMYYSLWYSVELSFEFLTRAALL